MIVGSSKSVTNYIALKRGGSKPKGIKADHRADTRGLRFLGIPHAVLKSPAYLHLSLFARAVLIEVLLRFTGYNNGEIAVSQRQVAERLRNSNYRKIGRAFIELFQHGLVDVSVEGTWLPRRARQFRLTFVSTGKGKHVAATNDYLHWSPGDHSSAANASSEDIKSADYVSTTTPELDDNPTAGTLSAGGQDMISHADAVGTLISNHIPVVANATIEVSTVESLSGGVARVGSHSVGGASGSGPAQPERWAKGTPLGGKFMPIDGEGFPVPPIIGSATNQEHQQQANAMYAAAKAGDWETLSKLAAKPTQKYLDLGGGYDPSSKGIVGQPGAVLLYPGKVDGKALNTQQKWSMQKLQYAQALIGAKGTATSLTAKVDAIIGPLDLSSYKKIGRKLGGTSDGALLREET